MHDDLEYVKSLEKEVDELESEKADFSNIYDLLLEECVSKDVICSYLHSLSDLNANTELQCLPRFKSTALTISNSKLEPKVVPLAVKTATSRQELELLFHHQIAMLRTTGGKVYNQSYIQPEPEDLPKDNPKLEIAVLSMSMLVKDIRSQDGKDDKDNDKGSKSRSQSMKEQDYNEDKDQEHSSLNDKSNLTDLMKEYMVLVYGAKPKDELKVSCYADASFQMDKDSTKSQTGYVFVLNGGAVDWKSAKQSTTAMSSTEAEYIVAAEASMEAV
ncbi:hypothetical protein Tco_1564309 [Tanacetum coccineum]